MSEGDIPVPVNVVPPSDGTEHDELEEDLVDEDTPPPVPKAKGPSRRRARHLGSQNSSSSRHSQATHPKQGENNNDIPVPTFDNHLNRDDRQHPLPHSDIRRSHSQIMRDLNGAPTNIASMSQQLPSSRSNSFVVEVSSSTQPTRLPEFLASIASTSHSSHLSSSSSHSQQRQPRPPLGPNGPVGSQRTSNLSTEQIPNESNNNNTSNTSTASSCTDDDVQSSLVNNKNASQKETVVAKTKRLSNSKTLLTDITMAESQTPDREDSEDGDERVNGDECELVIATLIFLSFFLLPSFFLSSSPVFSSSLLL